MVTYTKIGVLRAVNANWNDDGWNVNANSVENTNDWNAGNRVFSETLILLPSICGSFLFVVLFSIHRAVYQFLQILLIGLHIVWLGLFFLPKLIGQKI